MLGKEGHCRIDLDGEGEFREFYDFRTEEGEDGEGEEEDDVANFVRLEDGSVRLRSGRIVSNRKVIPSRPTLRRPLQDGDRSAAATTASNPSSDSPSAEPSTHGTVSSTPTPPTSPSPPTTSQDLAYRPSPSSPPLPPSSHELALSHLRQSDQTALSHLPTSQQRAILATQRQQVSAATRIQQTSDAKLAGKANKTAMKYFLPRVPKRKLGQHHMSLRA